MLLIKKLPVYVLIVFVIFFQALKAEGVFSSKILIDKIVARVNGVNILKSDLEKSQISKNGQSFTLQEAINEEVMYHKAIEKKMLPTELEIEKQIIALKIQNNLTNLSDEEFNQELKKEGFSIEEYKKQLGKILAVERLKHTEFNERVVVTSQEIEDYYGKNPSVSQEEFLIKMCDVPNRDVNEKGELIKEENLKWDDLGWIAKSDISPKLFFVFKMEIGEVSKPMKNGKVYQLIKLENKKGKHIKTLDERYIEIEKLLHDEKKEKFEKEFEKDLIEKSSIVYLD